MQHKIGWFPTSGPLQIKSVRGKNYHEVQRYNDPTSCIRKYKGSELYLLPPVIFRHEPIDTMDTKLNNYSNAPIVSPIQESLNIQLYNDHFFKPHSPYILQPSRDRPSEPIGEEDFKSHAPLAKLLPTIKELCHATNDSACPIEETPFDPTGLTHLHIQESKHKLLFIKFTPVSTLRRRWYLIQVDLDSPPNGIYYCVFLAIHPNNIHKSDKFNKWWTEWHKYSQCKDTNNIIYGQRVFILINKTPDSSRYIQWAYELSLISSPSSKQSPPTLLGPFNFDITNDSSRMRKKLTFDNGSS